MHRRSEQIVAPCRVKDAGWQRSRPGQYMDLQSQLAESPRSLRFVQLLPRPWSGSVTSSRRVPSFRRVGCKRAPWLEYDRSGRTSVRFSGRFNLIFREIERWSIGARSDAEDLLVGCQQVCLGISPGGALRHNDLSGGLREPTG